MAYCARWRHTMSIGRPLASHSIPVSSESRGAGNMGVRTTWPAMTSRADWTSVNVMLMKGILFPKYTV